MKGIILGVLACVLTQMVFAQGKEYKSWDSFQGDTISYLVYNFNAGKQRYIGKKVESVIRDYELRIRGVGLYTGYKGADFPVDKIDISYFTSDESVYNAFAGRQEAIIRIIPKNTLYFDKSPYFDYSGPHPRQEKDMHKVAMKMKDIIIKDIYVIRYKAGKPEE